MKKFIGIVLTLVLLFITSNIFAQNILNVSTATVGWNTVVIKDNSGITAAETSPGTYTFSIPTAGRYVVWGYIDDTGSMDSFFISMDGSPETETIWRSPGWVDVKVYNLIAGSHTLKIIERVPGMQINGIIIAAENSPAPGQVVPGTIKYQVYSRNDLVSTGVKVGSEITATQASLIFAPNVTYYIGVESVFYPTATPTVPQRSTTKAWSNNAADCLAGAFGFFYTPGVNPPSKLRLGLLGQLKVLIG